MPAKHRETPEGWELNRHRRNDDHIQNCPEESGYKVTSEHCQIHHALPVSSLSDAVLGDHIKDPKQIAFIRNCFAVTEWDINGKVNTIGLPLKTVLNDKLSPPGWEKLPCHLVDHGAYNEEVYEALTLNIWNPVYKESKRCKFEVTDLVEALNDEAKEFIRKLHERGKRPDGKGTKHAWQNRHKMKDTWYMGLSMAASPVKRSPPPKMDINSDLKQYMDAIFKAI